jgi:hypothetical protein
MKQKEVLNNHDKSNEKESYEYSEMLKQVISDKKIELEKLTNNIMNMQSRLHSVQVTTTQEKNVFDNHMLLENKKLEEAKKKLQSDTNISLSRIDLATQDMIKRELEIGLREKRIKDLEDEKKATIEERQKLGKLSFELDLKIREAQETKDISDEKINNCSKREDELDKLNLKLETYNVQLNGREEKVGIDLKRTLELKEEISKLRDEIKPQLEIMDIKKSELVNEQKKLDEKNEKLVAENDKTSKLIEQLEAVTKQVDNKKKDLFAKETELSQREARIILLEKVK